MTQAHKNKKWKTKNNGKKTASGPKYNSTGYLLASLEQIGTTAYFQG